MKNYTLTPTYTQGPAGARLAYRLELFDVNPDGSATVYATIQANAVDTIANLVINIIEAD